MRRGGPILLVLVLIIVILSAFAFLVVMKIGPFAAATTNPDAVPTAPLVKIVIARQQINQNDPITEAVLDTVDLPKNLQTEKMITDKQLVIGKYAAITLNQGWPLSLDVVTDRPTGRSDGILPGQVAISIPISRLDSVAYAIRDGDYVNVIATTLFVDLDASFQTILPNAFGQVVNVGSTPQDAPLVTLGMNNSSDNGTGLSRRGGRAELDPTLNQAVYYIPSESQRPRLVSQMILQDIQILHIGTFALDDEKSSNLQPTPEATRAGQPTPAPKAAVKPDIITLIVSPQDAVSLTYLLYSGTKLTLVLRAPDDRSRAETEAATLQYILSQYAIPIPAKLPYGIDTELLCWNRETRTTFLSKDCQASLINPVLPNDAVATPRP